MNEYNTDEELVNNYLTTRQQDYFEQLYKRYCTKVHRKCLSFTNDKSQADDLTQDIFLRLLHKLDGYKREAKFSTWLYSITYNYCTDQVRLINKRKQTLSIDAYDHLYDGADSDQGAAQYELADEQIQKAMHQLAPFDRRLLKQKYQDNITIRELAVKYSLTESAIKMRLQRSRARLRQYYLESESL